MFIRLPRLQECKRSFIICQADVPHPDVPTLMSPRPRTIDDGDILQAAAMTISRVGPSNFTLADVASAVGLSPATLVQRFGSKRGLMLALAEQGVAGVDACFAA